MPTFNRVAKLLSIAVLAAASLLGISYAQVDSASDVGHATVNYGYDSIDLSNLYLSFNAPIFSKPGSVFLPFSYSLVGFPNVAPGMWGQTATNVGLSSPLFGGLNYPQPTIATCGTSPTVATDSYSGFVFVEASGAVDSFGSPLSGSTATLACINDHQTFRTPSGSLYLSASVDSSYHMTYTVTNSQGTILANALRGGGYLVQGWQPSNNLGLNSYIYDQSGNAEIVNSCGTNYDCTSGTVYPPFTPTVGGSTTDGDITWLNLGPPSGTVTDVDGNTSSVSVTNLVAGTMFTGGGSLGTGTSRNYTLPQVWTYKDAMGLTALTTIVPALIASGNPYVALSNVQQTMAYTDAAGSTENVALSESYMGQSPPPSGCTATLVGPSIIGVNSTVDANQNIHGNSFAAPNVYSFYPTNLIYPDSSAFGFDYETVAGGVTDTSTVTTVNVTGNVAMLTLSSLSATTSSRVTKVVVTTTPTVASTVITITGTNPWKAGDTAMFAWMSTANLAYDNLQFNVSSVTSTTVTYAQPCSGCSAGTTTYTESQGYLVAPAGSLAFSGFTGATFLNGTTPLAASWGPVPYHIDHISSTTTSATFNYATLGTAYGDYYTNSANPPAPFVGEVVNVSGTTTQGGNNFNANSLTITAVGSNANGPYFTAGGTYTASSGANGGVSISTSQTGVLFLVFPFEHANYSGSETAAIVSNVPAITGRVSEITLPTGGYIKYAYSGGSNGTGINCPDASYATLTRTTNDGTTTYTHQPAGTAQTVYQGGTIPISTVYGGNALVSSLITYMNGQPYYSPFGLVATGTTLVVTETNIVFPGSYSATLTFTGQTDNLNVGSGLCLVVLSPTSGLPWSVPNTDPCLTFDVTSISGNTVTTTNLIANLQSGSGITGPFSGAVTAYLFASPAADPYVTGTNLPIMFYSAVGNSPSQTEVVDAAGNEALYYFSGIRQVDEKMFTGTLANTIVNPGFSSGTLADWTSNTLSTLPVVGTLTCTGSCASGTVAYADQGSNEDAWGTGNGAMNAANGTLSIGLGVSNAGVQAAGGYPPPAGTTTQTATITGISISGSTITAQVSGSLPSLYGTGTSVEVTLPVPQSVLNGTFTITAVDISSSPQTFSWTETTTLSCSAVVETITSSEGQSVGSVGSPATDVTFFVAGTNTFTIGQVVAVAGTEQAWMSGYFSVISASASFFEVNIPGEGASWSDQTTTGTGTLSQCHLLSSGSSSVTVTVASPPNIASVQVAEVNGAYTLLVTTVTPPSGVRIGTGGSPFTFSGMTHATWLNGLTLTPTTWDGQDVFGFAPPSGAPEPYANTAETTAFASVPTETLPTVYTSDWVYVTNLNMSNISVGSAITGVEFNDQYIGYTTANPTTLAAQLVNNGVRVGTAKNCTVYTANSCDFGSSTDTWGASGLTFGPGFGIALQATIQNPSVGNDQTLPLCCGDLGYSITINANSSGSLPSWSYSSTASPGTVHSATIATQVDTTLVSTVSETVNPGDVIHYGGWIERTAGSGNIWWTCQFLNSSGASLGYCPNLGPSQPVGGYPTTIPQDVTVPTIPWTQYVGTAIAPASTASVQFYAEVHGGGVVPDRDATLTTVFVAGGTFIDLSKTMLRETTTCYNQPFYGGAGNGGTLPCLTTAPISVSSGMPTEADTYTYTPGAPGPAVTTVAFDSLGRTTNTASYDYAATTSNLATSTYYGTYTGTLNASPTSANCSALANPAIIGTICLNKAVAGTTTYGEVASQYNTNGQLTAGNVVDSIDSKNFVTNFTYTTKGAVATYTEPSGHKVTYNYTLCNDLFLSSVSDTIRSFGFTYDCNSGDTLTMTDANSNVWTATYADPLNRVTVVKSPMYSTSYPDSTTYTYTANSIDSKMTFNSGATVDEGLTTTDVAGRPVLYQSSYASGSFGTTQLAYNNLGQSSAVSIPFLAAPGALATSPTSATTTYDAIGRPHTIHDPSGDLTSFTYTDRDSRVTTYSIATQAQTNGLGQVTSACQITGATGNGACGQDVAADGYLTTYAYNPVGYVTSMVKNAQTTGTTQTTSYLYDGFNRLTSIARPESGASTYVWDADSSGTCTGTYDGQVVRFNDANGNVTCYTYDVEGRVLSETHPSGPNSAATAQKHFVWDSSTTFTCPSGSTYQVGRLAEAYTGTSTTKITDEELCYNKRGDLTDVFESTPNSGGAFHTTATYWPDGSLDTITGIPGITGSFTYTPGYTWTSTVTGPSTTLLSGLTSTNGVNPAVVTYGSGDTDTFSLDASGRFSGFSATVGSQTVSNAWTWNTNTTPASMQITNPFDSASGNQTCGFAWTALKQISSYKCTDTTAGTAIWGQVMTYDQFGNIKKAIPTGYTAAQGQKWSPTYNLSNNQYTGSPFAYDADGQITNDSFSTYTWTATGKVATVTNITTSVVSTYTYDAFDRLVEEASSNVTGHTQFVQSPLGKVATTTSTK